MEQQQKRITKKSKFLIQLEINQRTEFCKRLAESLPKLENRVTHLRRAYMERRK